MQTLLLPSGPGNTKALQGNYSPGGRANPGHTDISKRPEPVTRPGLLAPCHRNPRPRPDHPLHPDIRAGLDSRNNSLDRTPYEYEWLAAPLGRASTPHVRLVHPSAARRRGYFHVPTPRHPMPLTRNPGGADP